MRDLIWRGIAKIVSHPRVADWLIKRAQRTPYTHIYGPKTGELYMERWWLFNPYPAHSDGRKRKWFDWMPSVRVHHIVKPDDDRHLHDHPWNARTIILKGGYKEELPAEKGWYRFSFSGATNRLLFGEYHRIAAVAPGTYTLFITWKYQGTWGFDVDGVKVPWREYLKIEENGQ